MLRLLNGAVDRECDLGGRQSFFRCTGIGQRRDGGIEDPRRQLNQRT